jgi:hypothetical protein
MKTLFVSEKKTYGFKKFFLTSLVRFCNRSIKFFLLGYLGFSLVILTPAIFGNIQALNYFMLFSLHCLPRILFLLLYIVGFTAISVSFLSDNSD